MLVSLFLIVMLNVSFSNCYSECRYAECNNRQTQGTADLTLTHSLTHTHTHKRVYTQTYLYVYTYTINSKTSYISVKNSSMKTVFNFLKKGVTKCIVL